MKRFRMMKTSLFVLSTSMAFLLFPLLGSEIVLAQYPTEPIMFMVPSGSGSGLDVTARTVAAVIQQEKIIPQLLQVFNREGGSGTVGLTELVNQHRKNPYMIMVTSPIITFNELNGVSRLGYRDVVPIAQLITDYVILAVREDSRFKTLKDLVEALKQNPASVSLAGGGVPGSANHLPLLYILDAAGVPNVTSLPYAAFMGDGKALIALLGGHADVASVTLGASISYLEAKKLRSLAVTYPKRLDGPITKDLATAKEQGADVVFPMWRGVVGPPGIPDYAVKYLQEAFGKMVKTKAWKEALEQRQWIDSFKTTEFKAFLDNEFGSNKARLDKLGYFKK